MIGVRLGDEVIRLEPEEWAIWVQDGRIPPQAEVLVEGRGWIRAGDLLEYRRALLPQAPAEGPPLPGLRDVVFPRRGFSSTEVLILVNLVVSAALMVAFRTEYLRALSGWATGWWYAVHEHGQVWWWAVTIFLHAGPKHLLSNMVALLVTSGTVEFLMGRRWTVAAYFLTGAGGMAISYYGHPGPPLSVGASGAVFGLAGCVATFLIRRYRLFTFRQRWKTRRVYAPLFVILVLPAILNFDYLGHVGGFLVGLVLGLFIPPHPRVIEAKAAETAGEAAGL